MIESIKIGRNTYQIKKGDYIQYNGACHLFCAGDDRTLYREDWDTYSHIRIPKTVLKTINLDLLERMEYKVMGMKIIKWEF